MIDIFNIAISIKIGLIAHPNRLVCVLTENEKIILDLSLRFSFYVDHYGGVGVPSVQLPGSASEQRKHH